MILVRDLLFYFLCIEAVFAKLYFIKNYNDFYTQKALLQIIKSCKKDIENIIIHDSLGTIYPIFLQQLYDEFYSSMFYQNGSSYNQNITHDKKVDVILITTQTARTLRRTLEKMRKMAWWDVMIPIYVLNVKNNNCDTALKIVKQTWDHNLLTSYCLCLDKNKDIQIFTYNPFTNRAPDGWIQIKKTKRVTFYKQKYNLTTICRELDFDRTKYLDGYRTVIGVSATNENQSLGGKFIDYTELEKNNSLISKCDYEILNALLIRLNVTLKLHLLDIIETDEDEIMLYESQSKAENTSANIILTRDGIKFSGTSYSYRRTDPFAWKRICNHLNDCLLMRIGLYAQTYPLAWKTIGIATYNRGYKTIGEKVWDFYGIWTILFTIFILLVTFPVIWISESKKTAFALFEMIRLLISHNLHTRMNTLFLRIFFITVLIYFLIIQATFNGHLAEFLTKPELRKHADTKEDLKALGYTTNHTYYARNVSDSLAKTDLEKKVSAFQVRKCLNHILTNDSSAACVLDHVGLLYHSRRNKRLYVSKKPSEEQYDIFWIRNNWPLVKRTNLVFISLEDFGFRKLWSDNDPIYASVRNLTVIEARLDEDFHQIKLENLMFSFWILTIGLTSATVSFCIEVFIARKSD